METCNTIKIEYRLKICHIQLFAILTVKDVKYTVYTWLVMLTDSSYFECEYHV